MAAKIVGAVWELDLSQADAWVLMALADHADHEGVVFAGQELLAWKTGYSERQVRRILDSLEEKRILIPQNIGRGRGVVQGYRIETQGAPRKAPLNKRTKCPVKAAQKADILSGEKAVNLSSFPEEKADISDAKSGHSDAEKRTFSSEKADISDISHDKERARRTDENHENRKEPTTADAREEIPFEAPAAPPTNADELERVLYAAYSTGNYSQADEEAIRRQAAALDSAGCQPDSLREFFAQRRKLPWVESIGKFYAEWAANQQRAVRAQEGSDGPGRGSAESNGGSPDRYRRIAERIKAGTVI